MKLIIKNGKHVCEICRRSFDWSSDCWSFGNLENDKEEAKVFCSSKCKKIFEKRK